jgi:hypothetical protein
MKTARTLACLAATAFIAATLQGSRLPEPAQTGGVAQRAGSGAGPQDTPPTRGGVLA